MTHEEEYADLAYELRELGMSDLARRIELLAREHRRLTRLVDYIVADAIETAQRPKPHSNVVRVAFGGSAAP